MSGGGGSQQTVSTTSPTDPAQQAFLAQTYPYLMQAQAAAPLAQFLQPQVRQIAGLSPTQQWAIAQTPNLAGMQAPEQTGLEQLAQLTSGEIGQSPLTQAGLQAFESIQRPQIENTLATMGLGRSGAGANILEQSRSQVLTPLIQQEIQQRQAAVPQLFGLGQNLAQRGMGAAQFGMLSGGQEQQTAQAALDAPLQDWLRRQQIALGITTPSGVPSASQTVTTGKQGGGGFFGK
jgi:hypothetical protein